MKKGLSTFQTFLLEKKNKNVFLEVAPGLGWYWGSNHLAHKGNIWWSYSWLNKRNCKTLNRISRKLVRPCTEIGWSSNYSIDLEKILLLNASRLIKICIAHVLRASGWIKSIKARGEHKVLFTAHHSLLLCNNQRVALISLGHLQGPLCHLWWGHERHIDKATWWVFSENMIRLKPW